MKIIHISYVGPDRRIKDAAGKVWRAHGATTAREASGFIPGLRARTLQAS